MANPKTTGTRDIPLKLAAAVTDCANQSWISGEMLSKTTPTTRELLVHWFCEPHTLLRPVNFHEGQRQSILNTIYLYEVLRADSVKSVYASVRPDLPGQMSPGELEKGKYDIPKYAIKMATGTGKTWVMHALVIWQYLNARHTTNDSRATFFWSRPA